MKKPSTCWPCDARVIHARFAREEIINLASRGINGLSPRLKTAVIFDLTFSLTCFVFHWT